jgi:hypothetical protein
MKASPVAGIESSAQVVVEIRARGRAQPSRARLTLRRRDGEDGETPGGQGRQVEIGGMSTPAQAMEADA